MNSSSDAQAPVDQNAVLEFLTVGDLLDHLAGLRVVVSVADGRIHVSAPRGALSTELRAALAKHRDELLAVLALQEPSQGTVPGIAPVTRKEPLLLSFGQERLWFLEHLEPGQGLYNIMAGYRLHGMLDVPALECALTEVVARHEVLRTVYIADAGQPLQIVQSVRPLTLATVDIAATTEDERYDAIMHVALEERLKPFDLARDLMIRAKLLHLDANDHVLLFTLHHIASDGWSMGVMWEELAALYVAYALGQESSLPALPVQYADFAAWQRESMRDKELKRQLAYWKPQLQGVGVLELPADRPRPAVQSFHGATHRFSLPATLVSQVRAIAQREGVTLYMLLLAAYQVLLFRYTGQEDIAVGTPVAGRNRVEIERLIGFFVNTLVMRVDLSGNPTFQELLARVRRVALDAYSQQELPFEKLVAELQPERHLSTTPLFQVMFVLHDDPGRKLVLPGIRAEPLEIDSVASKYDLSLSILDQGSQLRGRLVYDATLFDQETIERFVDHYVTLLESVVQEPEGVTQSLAQLPLLTPGERHKLLVDWNQTEAVYPGDRCFHELFEEQVARTPDSPAILWETDPGSANGAQLVTYAELDERADQLAVYLNELGIGSETLVGVFVEPSPEMLVAILGILKAGGAYLPLDPSDPPARVGQILEDSGVCLVLTQERLVRHLGNAFQRTFLSDDASESGVARTPSSGCRRTIICLDADWSAIGRQRSDRKPPRPVADPSNLAYGIYTSGSTGTPKGTLIEHRSLVNYLTWVNGTLMGENPCVLPAITKLTFDASLKQLLAPLLRGDAAWMVPADVARQPRILLNLLRTRDRAGLNCVPALWSVILDVVQTDGGELPALSHLFLGGEQLSSELVSRTFRLLPGVQLWNLYGPSEATANASAALITPASRVTIGRPVANGQLYIVDRQMQNSPIGVAGELCIGGVGLARGYLDQPGLTAERFVPDPFDQTPGARLYRTGDRARYLPDGSIEFLGRVDDQVKIRGFRVELGEIEAILRAHPGLRDAVVLTQGVAHETRQIIAFAVPAASQQAPSAEDLVAFLRNRLPEYMIPAAFVALETLPVTPTGKIDRKALRLIDGAGLTLRRVGTAPYLAPRTQVEETITGIWVDLLHVDQIGVADNFFDLGGHSLLAIQLMLRIQSAFSVELPLRTVFESPTVADLARYIDDARARVPGGTSRPLHTSYAPGVESAQSTDSASSPTVLSFGQERLWFLDQLEPEQTIYNVMAAYRILGRLDVAALERALGEIVARHEVLRTVIMVQGGEPVQVVQPPPAISLELVTLPEGATIEQEEALQQHALAERMRRFDLSQDLMLRSKLLRINHDDHVLMLTLHHIVSDGWSFRVLWNELVALYARYTSGAATALPDLAIQYRDFALWQRERLRGAQLSQQVEYWRRQLDAVSPLALPTDRSRPAVQTYGGAALRFALPEDLVASLLALARQEGVTLYMVLLAAFQVLLSRYSGQDDIAVGTPIAGRNREDVEHLIGFFANTLVMRTDLSGDPTFREVLARVRHTALEAYSHQDLPFEKLVQELQPERHLNRNPLFQVLFQLFEFESQATRLGEAQVEALVMPVGTARFDLEVSLRQSRHGLHGSIIYSTDLFDHETIRHLVGHFQTILEAIVADAGQPVWQLPILPGHEQVHLLEVLANGPLMPTLTDTVLDQLGIQVARTPDAPAILAPSASVCAPEILGPGTVLTFVQLDGMANQLANLLRTMGVGHDSVVGLLTHRSAGALIGILAILKAGGAYLPLDPTLPTERLAFMLQDAGSQIVLTQEELMGHLPEDFRRFGQASTTGFERSWAICLDADWTTIAGLPATLSWEPAQPHHLAYVMYTSGSTGKPKGVAMPHKALANLVAWHRGHPQLGQAARTLQYASLSFDVSFQEIFSTWCTGGTLVLVDEDTRRDPFALCALLRSQRIVRLYLPVAALQQVAQVIAEEKPGTYALEAIITAGEQLRITDGVRLMMAVLPNCTVHNHYGPTEAHVVTEHVLVGPASSWPELPPIGRPITNAQLLVLDGHQQLLPIGVPGELHIGGASVARGYLHRPDLTRQRFLPHPFAKDARLYRTGDLGRWRPDGTLEYLGRVDHQVKVRGYRVELGEVEATLAQHPSVAEVVVVVRQPTSLEGRADAGQSLVAYVVPRSGHAVVSAELRSFLRQWLPEHMIPADFVPLAAFPLNRNGKIDRSALPAPQLSWPELRDGYTAPRTPAERLLVRQWETVLGRHPVGIHENFFDLGGHSLLGVRLFAQIEHDLGIRLPLALLFRTPTVAELASHLEYATGSDGWHTVVPIQTGGARLPFFCVHGFGGGVLGYADLARLLGADQPFYGLQAAGLNGIDKPDMTVAAMANRYVQALRQVQPAGPYMVGGYCLGGVVAYEMATQLEAQGQQVALVAIMEGFAPARFRSRAPLYDPQRWTTLWRSLPYWARDYWTIGRAHLVRSARMRLLSRWHRATGQASQEEQSRLKDLVTADLSDVPEHHQRIMLNHLRALRDYVPGPYQGRVTLFRARWQTVSKVVFGAMDPTYGWDRLARGGVDVHLVEGSHRNVHLPPQVSSLAEELRQSIEAANGE